MSASVEPLGATRCVSPIGVENVLALLTPRGGSAALLTRARGRETHALAKAQPENWVKESGLPLAGQAMEPLTVSMVAIRPGRGVAWQIAEPLVPDGVTELGPACATSHSPLWSEWIC